MSDTTAPTKPSGTSVPEASKPLEHAKTPAQISDAIANEQFEAGLGTKRGAIGRPSKFLNPLRGSF